MRELPGEQDSAEDERARVQAARRAGPADEGRDGADQAADPGVRHCHPFHRSVDAVTNLIQV